MMHFILFNSRNDEKASHLSAIFTPNPWKLETIIKHTGRKLFIKKFEVHL